MVAKVTKTWSLRTTATIIVLVIFLFNTAWSPLHVSSFCTSNLNENSLKLRLRSPYVATLTHTITISVRSRIRDATLYVPLIRNETAHHFVIIQDSSQHYFQNFQQDSYGNWYAWWHRDEIRGGEVFSVSVKYYVSAFRVSFHIDSRLVEPYDNSSTLYQKYTQPEELIQSNHTEIISDATEIVGDEKNPHLMASKIYQFVVDTLTYVKQEKEKGALWALQNRRGDCSEFSYLFVALCRAVGIPSRIHAGFAFHRDAQTLSDGHMWAEYYLENYGWVPVDPTWHLFSELDSHHFSSLQSKPELMSYSNYFFNYSQVGSGGKPSDDQTIAVKKASIHLFDGFPSVQSMNDAVSKIEKAERTLQIAKLLGAHILLSSNFKKAEEKILNADLYVQDTVEHGDGTSMSFAQQYADEALDLAQNMVFKMMIISTLFLVVVIVVAAAIHGRTRRQQNLPYEYSY